MNAARTITVKAWPDTVNLREAVSAAVKREPCKVVALRLGVSHREVEDLRSGLRLPRVPLFLEIAKQDPRLKALVIAILSGEGEAGDPANINAIIKSMGGKLR